MYNDTIKTERVQEGCRYLYLPKQQLATIASWFKLSQFKRFVALKEYDKSIVGSLKCITKDGVYCVENAYTLSQEFVSLSTQLVKGEPSSSKTPTALTKSQSRNFAASRHS